MMSGQRVSVLCLYEEAVENVKTPSAYFLVLTAVSRPGFKFLSVCDDSLRLGQQ